MCRVFPNSHKSHNYKSLFVDESLKLDDVQNISVHSGNTQDTNDPLQQPVLRC